MISIGDPVRAGLVPSLARPGGNITGNTILGPDVGAKRLQILKEAIPTVSRVAFLWNPDNASNVLQFEEVQAVAPTLGVSVISVSVSPRIEFETAFAAMMKERPDAFAMTAEPFHQKRPPLPDPRSGWDLRCCGYAPITSHRHPRQAHSPNPETKSYQFRARVRALWGLSGWRGNERIGKL
jgi:ABC transporter substrate binding protein